MVTIIVEIGTNHMGDLNVAKRIIDIAVDSGADIVKFQRKNVEKIYTKKFLDSYLESPWGNTQREMRLHREFSEKHHKDHEQYVPQVASHDNDMDVHLQVLLQIHIQIVHHYLQQVQRHHPFQQDEFRENASCVL